MIEGSRINSKRIYILGAGSSIGHSQGLFPSITHFFTSALKLGYKKDKEFVKIGEYVQEALGLNIISKPFVNIEDLFTHIEIELERESSPKLLEIRQNLFRFIQNVLVELGKQAHGHGEYDKLNKGLKPNDTIITFNWDLLLDNVLGRENIIANVKTNIAGKQVNQYHQFVENLSAYSEWSCVHSVIEPYSKWPTNTGYYLKMHGSIDWFYCSNESCHRYGQVFPLLDLTKNYYCSECHEPSSPLLIPPVLNKGYRQYPLIRKIWSLAVQELRSATEIIIWGYSLPPTDFHSLWLIRQGRIAPLKKLVIINPHVTIESKKKNSKKLRTEFINRFRNIFNDMEVKLLLYESFSDYSNSKDIEKKYGLKISPRKIKAFNK